MQAELVLMHVQQGRLCPLSEQGEAPIYHLMPMHVWMCIRFKIRCIVGRVVCNRRKGYIIQICQSKRELSNYGLW